MKSRKKGIMFMLMSAFFFSGMNLFVKLAGTLPSTQKSFFCYCVSSLCCTGLMLKRRVPFRWEKKNTGVMIIRSILGVAAVLFHYYAVSNMNLADASILNKTSPFFVAIFCWMFLKEDLALPHVLIMAVAFAGSMLIVKPSFDFTAMLPALIALLGGITTGASYAAVRALGNRNEHGTRIVWFYTVFTVISTAPLMLLSYQPMEAKQLLFLCLGGFCSFMGQLGITYAYANAPGNEVSIYSNVNVVFAGIWSFMIWQELPDPVSLVGYVIIFGAAYALYRYNLVRAKALKQKAVR